MSTASKTRICTICGAAVYARQLCMLHYKRSQTGIPLDPKRILHQRDDVIEDVEWIIGTDSPASIAHRLGYSSADALINALRKWNRADLADWLRRDHVRADAA